VLAVGEEARRMLGRTPGHIQAIRPLKHGVIADFDLAAQMLRRYLERARRRAALPPRVIVGTPCGVTEVEARAVREAARKAGSRETYLIAKPMAAALGAGLPVFDSAGSMIVDIGGGTVEAAVLALGHIVVGRSVRVAGDEMDEAVAGYLRQVYSLAIGERTAEAVKLALGSACAVGPERSMEARGRDLISGLPRSATITRCEIREAIQEPLNAIVETVKATLEATPPELAGDIYARGIVLCGGGALLEGLDRMLSRETSMPVRLAADPLSCVVLGAGGCLEKSARSPALRALLKA